MFHPPFKGPGCIEFHAHACDVTNKSILYILLNFVFVIMADHHLPSFLMTNHKLKSNLHPTD